MSIPTMIDARPLVAAGLPLGPLTGSLWMYRTSGGRAHHVDERCDVLSSRTRRLKVNKRPVDLLAGAIQVCNRCHSIPRDVKAAIEWSKRGAMVAEVAAEFAALEHDEPSPQRTVALQRMLTRCNDERIDDELTAQARRLGNDITKALQCDTISNEVYRTVAALILASRDPSLLSTTQLAATREQTSHLREAFSVLAERIAAGASTQTAADAAIYEFLAAKLPSSPTLLSNIPPIPKFCGADFVSPVAWATAEWAAQRCADLIQIGNEWVTAIESLAAEMVPAPGAPVAVGHGYIGGRGTLSALAIASFPAVNISSDGSWLMAAPSVVLNACALTKVADVAPGNDNLDAILRTAAVLFDDFYDEHTEDATDDMTGEEVRAGKAIEAAVALLM